jgi:hypothetical protein
MFLIFLIQFYRIYILHFLRVEWGGVDRVRGKELFSLKKSFFFKKFSKNYIESL